jgi:signal peptidase
MANQINQTGKRKTASIITSIIAVTLGVLILVLLFFRFMPGFNLYVVKSGSMVPTIGVGNIVFTGPVGQVVPGTIITFDYNGETVTHRVYSMENGRIFTKGDANKAVDPSPITLSAIKGTYIFQLPGLGYISQLTSSKQGWFLLIIVPAVLLVFLFVKDILKETFRDDKKKGAAQNMAPAAAAPAAGVSPVEPTAASAAPKKSSVFL